MMENKSTRKVDDDGNVFWKNQNGQFHREDGPAIKWSDGYKEWYLNGEYHREDGPAVEYPDGSKSWYLNGKRHREDGPAFEWSDGYKSWYINGERHREDGPAVEYPDGTKYWFLNGVKYSEEKFNEKMDNNLTQNCNIENSIIEINCKKYKLVEV